MLKKGANIAHLNSINGQHCKLKSYRIGYSGKNIIVFLPFITFVWFAHISSKEEMIS